MDAMFSSERVSDDKLSATMPAWTESASVEDRDAVSTIFSDVGHSHGSSTVLRTTDDQFQRSSGIPVHVQRMKVDSDASGMTTEHMQPHSSVEISLRASMTSAQSVVNPVGIVYGSSLETTAKTKSSYFSLPRNFTTALPLSIDSKAYSKQLLEISQTRISEDTQKSLLFRDAATTVTYTGHVSTSYKPTTSLAFAKGPRLSVSATFQKSSAVTAAVHTDTEAAHSQFLSSESQVITVEKTTSQSSEASSVGYINEYISATYDSSEYC